MPRSVRQREVEKHLYRLTVGGRRLFHGVAPGGEVDLELTDAQLKCHVESGVVDDYVRLDDPDAHLNVDEVEDHVPQHEAPSESVTAYDSAVVFEHPEDANGESSDSP